MGNFPDGSAEANLAFLLNVQDRWIEQHPEYMNAMQEAKQAEANFATVPWHADPGIYMHNVRTARNAFRTAQRTLDAVRARLTNSYQGQVG